MRQQLKIKRILLTGVTVFAAIFLCVNLAIFGYAAFLGFQVQSTPDSKKIADFATQNAPGITIASSIFFSFLAGCRTACSVKHREILHNLLIGFIASLLLIIYGVLFSGTIGHHITAGAVILLCSWLGAKTGIHSKRTNR